MSLNKKTLLTGTLAALAVGPLWTLPAAQAHPGNGSGNGAEHGVKNRSGQGEIHAGGKANHANGNTGETNNGNGNGNGSTGTSQKCQPHEVAYVASGTLVSDSLTKTPQGTYSGSVDVTISHANSHAHGNVGQSLTFTVSNVKVSGALSVETLAPGDHAKVIGSITALAPKCSTGTFTATTTVSQLVFHPAH